MLTTDAADTLADNGDPPELPSLVNPIPSQWRDAIEGRTRWEPPDAQAMVDAFEAHDRGMEATDAS